MTKDKIQLKEKLAVWKKIGKFDDSLNWSTNKERDKEDKNYRYLGGTTLQNLQILKIKLKTTKKILAHYFDNLGEI